MRTSAKDGLTGLVCLAGGLAFFLLSAPLPEQSQTFPRAAALLVIIPSVLLIIRALRGRQAEAPATRRTGFTAEDRRVGAVIVASIVYAASLKFLGFFVASAIFIPACAWFLGMRRPVPLVLTTAGFLVVMYWLFRIALRVPLPASPLGWI